MPLPDPAPPASIALAPDVSSIVTAGVLIFSGATVVERDSRLDAPLAAAADVMRRACASGVDVAAVRRMYKQLGIDPTRTRPSSEALLRRVRRGDPLPRVNTLVDVCNWCSLERQLPYGLYDLDRVRGPIELRVGRQGEEYAGIRKDVVHVAGRLTLADADGPFGNPTSDSARTMVTPSTRRVLIVIFAPAGTPAARLAEALDLTARRVCEFSGAVLADRRVLAGAGPGPTKQG
jgi:DNA/RNA-binding domain of Phe-tRNA-synthetase-like protein